MTRKYWLDLSPSLLMGAGIIGSTFIAVRAAQPGLLVLAGPVLLALAVVSADVLASRLRGESSGPSPAALLMAGATVLAGWIVALRDPSLVKTLMPVVGAGSWATLLMRHDARRKACRSI